MIKNFNLIIKFKFYGKKKLERKEKNSFKIKLRRFVTWLMENLFERRFTTENSSLF